jgi:hypothetical protein
MSLANIRHQFKVILIWVMTTLKSQGLERSRVKYVTVTESKHGCQQDIDQEMFILPFVQLYEHLI